MLNEKLFDGLADAGELGAPMPDQGVIKWSHTSSDNTRWYGVTVPLLSDERAEGSQPISELIGKNHAKAPLFTDEARGIIKQPTPGPQNSHHFSFVRVTTSPYSINPLKPKSRKFMRI